MLLSRHAAASGASTMSSPRPGSAVVLLAILLCFLQIGPLSAAGPPGQAQPGGRGGGRGDGGLPPMNPIDENAPPPPLVTPGSAPGAPPSDAVVLFNGTDLSQWTLRDG